MIRVWKKLELKSQKWLRKLYSHRGLIAQWQLTQREGDNGHGGNIFQLIMHIYIALIYDELESSLTYTMFTRVKCHWPQWGYSWFTPWEENLAHTLPLIQNIFGYITIRERGKFSAHSMSVPPWKAPGNGTSLILLLKVERAGFRRKWWKGRTICVAHSQTVCNLSGRKSVKWVGGMGWLQDLLLHGFSYPCKRPSDR